MYFDTDDEYAEEITKVQAAIRRILLIGASSSNNSGGSSRTMTDANLGDLRDYLKQLKRERKILNDDVDCVSIINLGW